jgi:predicted nucleic acid-binding protein
LIVVDANVVASLYLPGPLATAALRLADRDPDWAAPSLLRSELRNILATYMKLRSLKLPNAIAIQQEAELLMSNRFYELASLDVLALAEHSGCSAYDCEYVVLARQLGLSLVTDDRQLLRRFPGVAVPLHSSH